MIMSRSRYDLNLLALLSLCLSCLIGPGAFAQDVSIPGPALEMALSAPDRPQAHRSRDGARLKEVEFVSSYIRPGQSVLDLGAGEGYMSWILSSLVGPEGSVTVHNPQSWVDYYNLDAALKALPQQRPNFKTLVTPFEAIPTDTPFDVIFAGLIYHDSFNEVGASATVMNAALYKALKSGGLFIITDHYAASGSRARDTFSLHRIDKNLVIEGVSRAGFKLVLDSDVLRHPEDDRSLIVFDPKVRGKTDRFVLVFQKP
jgi:predicted methyltransferase